MESIGTPLQISESTKRKHGPWLTKDLSDDGVIKSEKHFDLASKVDDLVKTLPPFEKGVHDKAEFTNLPTLGPYEYHITDYYAGVFFTYQGQYKDKNRHGYGVEVDMWGQIYEGFWNMGMKEGQGRMIYKYGAYYIGGWKANVFHGAGKYVDASGKAFEKKWNPTVIKENWCFDSDRHVIVTNLGQGEEMGLLIAGKKEGTWVIIKSGEERREKFANNYKITNTFCALI